MSPPSLLWIVILSLITAAAYWPALRGGYVWDDNVYLTDNPLLTDPDGLGRIWFSLDSPSQYFPLVYTSFRLERSLWGLDPAGYHAVNVALHLLNALLLWRLLSLLGLPGGWLAAGLFALHPVQVESVAWITERKNVLSVFFSLLTLLCWARYVDGAADRPSDGRGWRRPIFYVAAGLSYLLALSSKTTASTLPVAMAIIVWLKEGRIRRPYWPRLIPFVLVGTGMGLVTVWWERHHQGTSGPEFAFPLAERVLIAGRAFWFYVGKLLWPHRLSFSYPRWRIDPGSASQYVWPAALLVLGIALWRLRSRTGPGPVAAFLFHLGTLAPLLGFISLYTFRFSFVADHYQYLAAAGVFALAAGWYEACILRPLWIRGPAARLAGLAVPVAVLLVLGSLTWSRASVYRDEVSLWRDTVATNPASWMGWSNLGAALLNRKDFAQAETAFGRALSLKPDHYPALHGLANSFAERGETEEAIRYYREALGIYPDHWESHFNLANTLASRGELQEAVRHYLLAARLKPDHGSIHNNLGSALARLSRFDEAERQFDLARRIDPGNPLPYLNLGHLAALRERHQQALGFYREALRFDPDSAAIRRNIDETENLLYRRPGRPSPSD